jgi:hypothetical protein
MLNDGWNYSINELSHLLNLNRKRTFDMRVSMTRLRYIWIVREFAKDMSSLGRGTWTTGNAGSRILVPWKNTNHYRGLLFSEK